ncbi:MAG: hypothetical protein AB7P04_03620 [Bacteriovoracia bacterium]
MARRRVVGSTSLLTTVAICLGLALTAPPARAEFGAIAVGTSLPTTLGDNYLTYARLAGVSAQIWWSNEKLLGNHFEMVLTGVYQPFAIRGMETTVLRQLGLFTNIEWREKSEGFVLSPFMSVGPGFMYSWLSFPQDGMIGGVVGNSGGSFAMQIRVGASMKLFDPISLELETPFTVVFNRNSLLTWAASLSLRMPI